MESRTYEMNLNCVGTEKLNEGGGGGEVKKRGREISMEMLLESLSGRNINEFYPH